MRLAGNPLPACRVQKDCAGTRAKRAAMKDRKHERLALAKIAGCWLLKMIALAKAVRYGCAAQRDERNGFHYTAAIEW
jgi:hypothetical protein